MLESHGKEAADEVTSFESRHLTEIARLVKRDNIDCDFVMTRATDVCLYDEGSRDIEAKLARLGEAGVTGIEDVFHVTGEKAEGVGPSTLLLYALLLTAGL